MLEIINFFGTYALVIVIVSVLYTGYRFGRFVTSIVLRCIYGP